MKRRRHGAMVGRRRQGFRPAAPRPNWEPQVGAAWQHRAVRVHRSFAFVDVSGFTALTELEGDERAVDVLTAFRALLRDICAAARRADRQMAG